MDGDHHSVAGGLMAITTSNRTIIRDKAGLESALPQLLAAGVIGVNSETTALSPLDGRLRVVTLAIAGETFVIDGYAALDWSLLDGVMRSPRPIKVFHNAKFDCRWLLQHTGLRVAGIFDTMLASQLLAEVHAHSLASVSARYLAIERDKTLQTSHWEGDLTEAQWDYAARDAEMLLALRDVLRPRLIAAGLTRVAALEFALVPVVAQMEQCGVHLDTSAWRALQAQLQQSHEVLEARLQHELAGQGRQLSLLPELIPSINLNSNQQVREALARLGVVVSDTLEATLQTVVRQHPVVETLLAWRGVQKALSAYGERLPGHVHPRTGRIHPHFQQIASHTGRFACSSPNLQNIPVADAFRACFTATPGYRLVIADYSQIELRILAELSGDAAFARAFEEGLDLHRMTASEMFWVPYERVSKEQRAQAKGINFGLMYGRGAQSLAQTLGVSREQAKALMKRFFERYRGVTTYLDQTAREAVNARALRALSGRRMIYDFDDSDRAVVAAIERQAKNFPIQATNSDILKQAMVDLAGAIAPYGARLVNCVHDELVVEAPISDAERIAGLMRDTMTRAGQRFLHRVPVEVDVHVADAWLKG
jgi:DNA polymerase-1